MKIGNKTKKPILIIVIAAVALILVGILVFCIIRQVQIDKENKTVKGIAVSVLPKNVYYVGEEFDPENLMIQVIAGSNEYSYFVDYPNADIKLDGFDSSVPNDDLKITVKYKEFTTSFGVKILEIPSLNPTLKEISVGGLKTTYTLEKWNRLRLNLEGATLKCVYTDDSVKEIPLIPSYIYGANKVDAPGEYEITVKYSEGAIQKEISVKITITE